MTKENLSTILEIQGHNLAARLYKDENLTVSQIKKVLKHMDEASNYTKVQLTELMNLEEAKEQLLKTAAGLPLESDPNYVQPEEQM